MKINEKRWFFAPLGVLWLIFAASFIACEDTVTAPETIGSAELVYELDIDVIPHPDLADVSADNSLYVIKGWIEEPYDHQLWYVKPPEAPVMLASTDDFGYGFPIVSPDNRNIVYEGGDGLYLIPVTGGAPRLVFPKKGDAQPFQWIDNERVLISSAEMDGWHIRELNVNTTVSTTLLQFDPEEVHSLWRAYMSPDGKYIGMYGEGIKFRLYDLDTGGFEVFDFGWSYCYKWSPDGSKMLHNRHYFDLASGELVEYYRNPRLELDFFVGGWTPDGKKVFAGERHSYNIYEYDTFKVYEVTVE